MDTKAKEAIEANILYLLEYRGTIERRNEIRLLNVWQDEKIYVDGLLPLDLSSKLQYSSIYVGLELKRSSEKPFALMKRETTAEPVFYLDYRDDDLYFRPGLWVKYLEKIVLGLKDTLEQNRRRNGQPINDEELFPEFY